jgi:hypothetical protein
MKPSSAQFFVILTPHGRRESAIPISQYIEKLAIG